MTTFRAQRTDGQGWITPYSTYLLSRCSTQPKKIVECENKNCKKKFVTNIDRKRCSRQCAKQARKQIKTTKGEFKPINEVEIV